MRLKDVEKSHTRGLSLEPDIASPYILPAALHGSRESLHSLSQSTKDSFDPYRPVTSMRDDASIRSGSRFTRHDNASMYTTSSGGTTRMNDGLLKNAQRMSQSVPLRSISTSPTDKSLPDSRFPEPAVVPLSPLNPRYEDPLPPSPAPPVQPKDKVGAEPPASAYVAFTPSKTAPVTAANPPPPPPPPVQGSKARATTTPSPPPRVQSQAAVVQENGNTMSMLSESSYGGDFQVTPPSPTSQEPRVTQPAPLAPQPRRPVEQASTNGGLAVDDFGRNTNRLSMSLRPLPPDDPNEDPEQRANRIRSFYKEYFDDSKPEPAGQQIYNDYYEDYTSEYLDGTVFDPHTGNFVVAQPQAPFAQPVTRRAMTPPPRAPPRFRSNTGSRGPHMSQSSMGSGRFPPPRNMSSMSGRLPAPRKPMPPPAPLTSLPTPGKLQDDSGIFNAADFAPPVSFRDRQNGLRPDSPLGAPRPFSPSVRPHTPLASSFDDLAVMPSPYVSTRVASCRMLISSSHMLRKSGTFTALDFAPPPRLRDPGSNASDAGSIRSNRSGMSAAGRMAVRAGAYRVSRIPKEVVGTQDDMATSLRPTLNMVAPA